VLSQFISTKASSPLNTTSFIIETFPFCFRPVRKIVQSDCQLRRVLQPASDNFASTVRIFMKVGIWGFFLETLAINSKFDQNLTTITVTLHEYLFTIVLISGWILLRIIIVSDKNCRENRNTHFALWNFPPPPHQISVMWETKSSTTPHKNSRLLMGREQLTRLKTLKAGWWWWWWW